MIQEIFQIQGHEILHIDPLFLHRCQFQVIKLRILFFSLFSRNRDISSYRTPSRSNHIKFYRQRRKFRSPIILVSEIFVFDPLLELTLKTDSVSEILILDIDFHRDHAQDLHRHLEDKIIIYNQIPLKTITISRKNIQNRKTNLKLIFLQLKWQMQFI